MAAVQEYYIGMSIRGVRTGRKGAVGKINIL